MVAARRVLHVAAGNLYGGVESFLVTLAKYGRSVPDLESEFAVCFEGRLANELRNAGARVHSLGNVRFRDPVSVIKANLAISRILGKTRYDAVLAHGAWPHVLVGGQVKLRRRRLVSWVHGAPLEVGPIDQLANWIRPDLVIANSYHTQAALGPLYREVPSRVVYCAIEPSSPARSRAQVRQEFGTADHTTAIAFAARFERWKGHHLLLRAASVLNHAATDDWRIWMCGGVQRESEKQYLSELQAYVVSHGLESRVKFLGQRTDVPDVLGAADIFCQPNTEPEPFGIVFVEALYAGLPVVATDMGGAAEIVNPQCGILTEPEPAAVAEALARLISDSALRRSLAAAAPSRANDLCNPKQRIADIAKAIATLDGRPGSAAHSAFQA